MFTAGSALLCGLLVYGKMKHKRDYLLYVLKLVIVFSVYLNIGYFLRIGGVDFSYEEVLLVFFILCSLLLVRMKLSKTSILSIIAFGIVLFAGYLLLINNPAPPMVLPIGGSWDKVAFGIEDLTEATWSSSHIKRIVRIVLFIVAYCIFDQYVLKDKERMTSIKRFIVKMAVFTAWIGVVEQFFKMILHSDVVTQTASSIFGVTGSQLTWVAIRGDYAVLQGLMLEPGHYAQSFLPAILILLRDRMFTEAQRLRISLLFAYVIFFCGSFAGFAILCVMLLLYVSSEKKKMALKIYLISFVAVVSVVVIGQMNSSLFSYYLMRVSSLFGGVDLGFSTSDGVRMLSLQSATELFKSYPFLGVGFGTTDVKGFIPSMLANFGIIGTVLWFVIMMRGFTSGKIVNLKWLIVLLPLFFFIGGVKDIYGIDMILIFAFVFRLPIDAIANSKLSSVPLVKTAAT